VIATDREPLRLHLGCGEVYLPGYVNIDLPPALRADLAADVTALRYEPESVAEIRLHHVFEHFTRGTALRLLLDWYDWLVADGVLTIETPDFERSAREFARRPRVQSRAVLVRHLFGSHEADWAVHRDGWYRDKFAHVLGGLGYADLSFAFGDWKGTFNITVTARKRPPFAERRDRLAAAERVLRESLVDDSPSEQRLLEVWLSELGSEGSR
jgi:hypothetical protein